MDNNFEQNPGHDDEAAMAKADLYKLGKYSIKMYKMLHDGQELEAWVQAKITKAADYIASVYHYMEYEMKQSEYGEQLETADMYSESVKRAFQQKLMEAKQKMAKSEQDEEDEEIIKRGKQIKKSKDLEDFDPASNQKSKKQKDDGKVTEAKKPSTGLTSKEKSTVVKKAKAGEDIGKKGKGFDKVEKAAKKSGAKDPKAVAGAALWKAQAAKKAGK